jgi:hypothetical protein
VAPGPGWLPAARDNAWLIALAIVLLVVALVITFR